MAKGKRAAALFEVIQAAKQKEQLRAQGGGFMTPKWWFKSKLKDGNGTPTNPPAPIPATPHAEAPAKRTMPSRPAPIVPDISEPEPQAESSPVVEHAGPDVEATSSEIANEDALSATFTPEPAPPSVHHDFVDNEEPAMEDPKPGPVIKPARSWPPSPTDRGSAHKPVDVAVDRGRQQIVLRLSFTSAAISTFAILVVVALIVLATKSFTRGPSTADGSIASVKSGKVTPGVLSVFQGKGSDETSMNGAPTPAPLPKLATPPQDKRTTTPSKSTPGKPLEQPKDIAPIVNNTRQSPADLNAAGKRIIGRQYVLIQAYPDPQDAEDAAEALKKAGIDCTVEKGRKYAPTWSCVIGTRGFDRTKNNPEFDAYIKSIKDVNNVIAGKFKKFEPLVVGWKD